MLMSGIISKCSNYETCRALWERDTNDNRNLPPFTCKECVGYQCYCIGFSDGVKQAVDVVKGEKK